MTFVPVKTHDVVLYQGMRYLVTGVDVTPEGAVVQMQPISPQVVSAPLKSVALANPSEVARRSGVSVPHRLVASETARRAWVRVPAKKDADPQQKPLTPAQVEAAMRKAIKLISVDGEGKLVPLTQKRLDMLVDHLVGFQAYRVKSQPEGIKSTQTWATWQQIAAIAVRLGNDYNKSITSSSKI